MGGYLCHISSQCGTSNNNGSVISLDFHPSEETLCSSDKNDYIKVWDLERKCMICSSKEGGNKVRFQPVSGKLLAVAKRNVITILEYYLGNLNVKYRLQVRFT
ncbi:hypothetical protein P8452_32921 [Trifolium repens]|nr:hypothetical protein P8452_32921 [Trifolium repens]